MKLLEDFRSLPEKKQKSITASAAIILLLVAVGIGAAYVQAEYIAYEGDLTLVEQTQDAPAQEQEPATDTQDTTEKNPSYDAATTEFIEKLTSKVWMSDTATIEFSESSFMEMSTETDEPIERAYKVKSITSVSTYDLYDTTEAIIDIEGTFTTVTLQPFEEGTEDGLVPLILICPEFSYGPYLESLEDSFHVESLGNDTVLALIGKDESGLSTTLQAYCAKNLPSVTRVAWNKSCLVDFDLKTVALYFVGDNQAGTTLCALYEQSTQTWTVKTMSGGMS